MNKIITKKEMAEFMWKTLEKIVEENYPEDEREKAKARILKSMSYSMFYGTFNSTRSN